MIPFLFIGVPAFISFGLGWWGRGHWDKAGRPRQLKATRLADLNQPDAADVIADALIEIERHANGEAK